MSLPDSVRTSVLGRSSGDLRILIRVAGRGWPELAGRTLVYLLDGEDESRGEIPVYLPDKDEWITVSADTIGARTSLTMAASRSVIDAARESAEYALGAKVRVMRKR